MEPSHGASSRPTLSVNRIQRPRLEPQPLGAVLPKVLGNIREESRPADPNRSLVGHTQRRGMIAAARISRTQRIVLSAISELLGNQAVGHFTVAQIIQCTLGATSVPHRSAQKVIDRLRDLKILRPDPDYRNGSRAGRRYEIDLSVLSDLSCHLAPTVKVPDQLQQRLAFTQNGAGDPTQNGAGDPTQNGAGDPTQNGAGDPTQNGQGRSNTARACAPAREQQLAAAATAAMRDLKQRLVDAGLYEWSAQKFLDTLPAEELEQRLAERQLNVNGGRPISPKLFYRCVERRQPILVPQELLDLLARREAESRRVAESTLERQQQEVELRKQREQEDTLASLWDSLCEAERAPIKERVRANRVAHDLVRRHGWESPVVRAACIAELGRELGA
jgi:hypothetical protein